MSFRRIGPAIAAVASVMLVLGTIGAADAEDRPSFTTTGTSAGRPSIDPPQAYASGVIVRTVDGSVSSGLRAKAEALTDGAVARTREVVGDARVLVLDEVVPVEEAQAVADALERRSDVVSAEPDRIMTPQTTSPVSRNDRLFGNQYNVWDRRSYAAQGQVRLPTGGYSVRAPYLWRSTRGKSSVKVAVIDTGITNHHDLNPQVVPGYDFFTPAGANADRDGTAGRDNDASDPGDWTQGTNFCGDGARASRSSWHGTHVAGIIAATANNKNGIAGIASGVRVQPIRALGPCGGSTSDIADAIVWAAGGEVAGVPTNPTPAKVINLSLGGPGPCELIEGDSIYTDAIHDARMLGAVVVAAAGNGSTEDGEAPLGSPANCPGAIAVTASSEVGQAATYSSLGTSSAPADIAAPGGDTSFEGFHSVPSTVNGGPKGPTAVRTYSGYEGTSMATPAVSAGAALLASLGYTRGQIETALKYAVRGFPRYRGNASSLNCSTTGCGRGMLDLSRVPAPYGKVAIRGNPSRKMVLRAQSHWTGSPSIAYRWSRNGRPITGATSSRYKVKTADRGQKLTVTVTGRKSHFKTLTRSSAYRRGR